MAFFKQVAERYGVVAKTEAMKSTRVTIHNSSGTAIGFFHPDQESVLRYLAGYVTKAKTSGGIPVKAGTLKSLVIQKDKRGIGSGRQLLREFVAKIKDLGGTTVFLLASPLFGSDGLPLEDLVKFYESEGFRTYAHKSSGPRTSGHLMRLDF